MVFNMDIDPNMPLIFVILVIGIMAILALGFVNVRFLFYAWVATLPFAQWSLYDLASANLYIDRIILAFVLPFILVHLSMRKIVLSKISAVELLMVGFTLICLVSAGKSNSLDRVGFAVLLNTYIYPFFGYYLAKSFMQREGDIRTFSVVITYLGLYLAFIGICEQLYPALVFPRYIVDPKYIISGYGRSVGPSLEPVGYGVGLLFCLLLSTYLFFKINNSLSPNKILALTTILMAPIAIFFTYTRAVWTGLVSSIILLFLFYPRGKRIFGSLLAIFIIGFILTQTMQVSKTEGSAKDVLQRDTIYFRISMAKTGIIMFVKNPIFGLGQFQYSKKFTPYFEQLGTSSLPTEGFLMHNTFLNILVELGLIGFAPFVLILTYLIKDAIILYKTSMENRDIAIIFLASCAAFILAGFANDMHYAFAHVLLFSMAGMTKGLLQGKTFSQERTTLRSKAAYT